MRMSTHRQKLEAIAQAALNEAKKSSTCDITREVEIREGEEQTTSEEIDALLEATEVCNYRYIYIVLLLLVWQILF